MKVVHIIAFILLVVGGLNWGIYAIWGTDIGAWLGGMNTALARTIYALVAVAAIFEVATHGWNCKQCKSAETQTAPMSSM